MAYFDFGLNHILSFSSWSKGAQRVTAGLSVLLLTIPQIVLASSQYPPLEVLSYTPFDTVCTDEEIEKTLAQLENEEQVDVVFRALTACGAEAVPELLDLLKTGSLDIQKKVLNALADMGPEARGATTALALQLNEVDKEIAERLPFVISEVGQEEAVPFLIEALSYPNAEVQERTAWALGSLGPAARAAVPALRQALQIPQLRDDAARALGDIGPDAVAATSDLVSLLAEESASNSIASALAGIGSGAVPDLILALGSTDLEIQRGAADALRRMPKGEAAAAVPALIQALNEESLQFYAVDALSEIGPPAATAVPTLVELLGNEDIDHLVINALTSIGEPSVSALIEALNSSDVQTRYNALEALERIGPAAAKAVPVLAPLLADRTEVSSNPFWETTVEIRIGAIRALGAIGPNAQPVIPQLIGLLTDPNETVRIDAALALAGIGQAAVPDLTLALDGASDSAKALISVALGEIGKGAQLAAPVLINLLHNPSSEAAHFQRQPAQPANSSTVEGPESNVSPTQSTPPPDLISPEANPGSTVQLSAALALGKIGVPSEAAVPHLITLLRNEDADIQAEAAYALGNMGVTAQAAIPDLIQIMGRGGLTDFASVIAARDNATEALIKIGSPAIPALAEALRDENIIAHSHAAYALGEIGAEAIPVLIEALANPDIHVRRRAAFALGKIGEPAVPALVAALQSPNLIVQKAAAAALGQTEVPNDSGLSVLRAIVIDETKDLDLRRIAASALEQLGEDQEEFFQTYNLLSPRTAACPDIGLEEYEFDILTGNCLLTYQDSVFLAGLGGVLRPLCRLLRC